MSDNPSAVNGAASSPGATPSTPPGEERAPFTPETKRAELAARRKARAAKLAAQRERARQRAAARRAAAKSGTDTPREPHDDDQGEGPAVPAEEPPARSDEELTRDLATLLGVVWTLLGFLAGMLGWRLKPLTAEDRRRGAEAFLPVARQYPIMAAPWLAIPLWVVATVTERAERAPKAPAAPAIAHNPNPGGA